MRLLYAKDGEFSLVERLGNAIPPYAILSHTWGKNEDEVTFQEISEGERSDKYGWHKIDFCGKQAVADGLEYFWIDTCCIDKSSSNELGEAINSMFHWYKESAICYVYLRDVSTKHSAAGSRSTWADQFRESMWFTRGWTLQELIAPQKLVFYSVEGTRLGDKHDMAHILQDITGIDIEALRGTPLSRFSTTMRMSWAAGRETKREEDWAYSLFGIFDVNMPLIFGEGRKKARKRLEKEIDETYSVVLPVAEGASFDSHVQEHNARCLPDTRVALLDHINQWTKDTTGKPIFWLSGMAGTGKSTVARTVARFFADRSQLGASFFFKKGDGVLGNASRFFTTLAMELMASLPEMGPAIKEATTFDPHISTRTLGYQFDKLILNPLIRPSKVQSLHQERIIVIDALDECEQDEDIREILRLLSRIKELQCTFLRVFVTSRPELYIRLGFKQMSNGEYENIILHEIAEDIVKHDIGVFLEHEFEAIRTHRSLPLEWPSRFQLQALVDLAAPLFIFAATACRYIGDPKHNPQRRLELLLTSRAARSSRLESTYLPILHLLFEEEDEEDKEKWIAEFCTIVGSIIMLRSPLSKVALAHLIKISKFDIGCRLYSLHSVLSVPSDENLPIRSLHLSLRDYLIDPQKQGKSPIWIDERQTHETLAWRCIDLMSGTNGLRRNVCDLESPRASRRDIDVRTLSRAIPTELQYACRYWTEHLEEAALKVRDSGRVHQFLVKHFLHWLEAMRLLGHAKRTLTLLDGLLSLSDNSTDPKSYGFIFDARQFTLSSNEVANETVQQLYSSALVFIPTTSEIRQKFEHHIAGAVERLSTIDGDASPHHQRRNAHSLPIHTIEILHDGMTAVTVSYDMTLALWELKTGRCLNAFSAHTDWISAVSYSPNDHLVASASHDTTVRLLDTATGSLTHALEGHIRPINAIAFSGNATRLASASDDTTIRIWDTTTGTCHSILQDHVRAVNDVAFADDNLTLASASDDGTVRLWNIDSGMCHMTLIEHLDGVIKVVFSHNNRYLASTSTDKAIRVWSVRSGRCIHVFRGHTGWVNRPLFSPDDRNLASVSRDRTIMFWGLSRGDWRGTEDVMRMHSARWPTVEQRRRSEQGSGMAESADPEDEQLDPHKLFVQSGWVFRDGVQLLRVPEKFDGFATAVKGGLLCIGTGVRLTILRFH